MDCDGRNPFQAENFLSQCFRDIKPFATWQIGLESERSTKAIVCPAGLLHRIFLSLSKIPLAGLENVLVARSILCTHVWTPLESQGWHRIGPEELHYRQVHLIFWQSGSSSAAFAWSCESVRSIHDQFQLPCVLSSWMRFPRASMGMTRIWPLNTIMLWWSPSCQSLKPFCWGTHSAFPPCQIGAVTWRKRWMFLTFPLVILSLYTHPSTERRRQWD